MFNRYYEKALYPSTWTQVSLLLLSEISTGNSLADTEKKKYSQSTNDCLIYVSTKDISMLGTINYATGIYIPQAEISNFKVAKANSILICLEGANAGNKIAITNQDVCYVNKLCAISCLGINNRYLYYFFRSEIFRKQFFDNIQGIIGGIPLNKFKELDILLPPIEEQNRIVSKIDSIFAILDNIDAQSAAQENIVATVKEKILSLAIQGKLVPQDENDEPASVLLEQTRAEKKRLLGKKYIDSYIYKGDDNCYYEKVGSVVKNITEEIPFNIPEAWKWIRLGSLFQHNTGKALNSTNTAGKKYTYITTSNLYWNMFLLGNLKEMFFTESELDKCTVSKGDLLVCEGGDIGRAAIWNYDFPMRIQNHIHRLRPYHKINIEFYYYIFFFYKLAGLIDGKGIAIQGLSSNTLDNILIPLPSVNEQNKIVFKIQELLKILKDEG